MLENGANVNAKKRDTPLHIASRGECKAFVSLLSENGADVNANDDTGWMPLHWASKNGHEAIIS